MKAPKIYFKTPIHHPNIKDNIIYMLLLLSHWLPALSVSDVLLAIIDMMKDPGWGSEEGQKLHGQMAREWTLKYAK